jgi:quaternary ammonium compound-resistance protein SugE
MGVSSNIDFYRIEYRHLTIYRTCLQGPLTKAGKWGWLPVIYSPVVEERCMSWIYLVVAGLLEVAWAVGLKYTAGFTRLWPSVFTLVTMAGSVGMLGLALRQLPLGTAYAVWTGIGTIGTAVAGMLMLGEPAGALRLGSIALIAAGIVGLKLVTPG